MEIERCHIPGLLILRLKLHKDERGFFAERFNEARFAEAGLPARFVQDNHSHSAPKVLRALHYQSAPAQSKLVGVVRGRVWDVAVDIRPDSPTFGQHHALELSAENATLFWVPAGFAHGFCVLGGEPADMLYKVDHYYNAQGEGGIRYDDPDLTIPWPIKDPILNARDRQLPSWQAYCANPPEWSAA